MDYDSVPPWGCPWHGLIQGGQLQLPNSDQIPMRQPGGSWPFERGRTSLIDLGAPPVERSAEQQQADAEAGIRWEHRAILAGDQVHGRQVGAGSWIYRAPDGSNWLASTSLHGSTALVSGSTVELVLRRFGELGGAAETYSYAVAVPDLAPGVSPWAFPLSDVVLLRYDTHVLRYSTADGTLLPGPASQPSGTGRSLAICEEYVATTSTSGTRLKVYERPDWSVVAGTPSIAGNPVYSAFSPDGRWLLLCNTSAPWMTVIDTANWSVVSLADPPASATSRPAFSADGSRLAVVLSSAPYLQIYSTDDWSLMPASLGLFTTPNGMTFSP